MIVMTHEERNVREGAFLYAAYCIAESVSSQTGWFTWRERQPRTHQGGQIRQQARDLGNAILASTNWDVLRS